MSEPDTKETDNPDMVFEEHYATSITEKEHGTKKAIKRKATETVAELESATHSDADGETTNSASRFRSVVAKRSRLRGKLADMMKMPIDIFAEVLLLI